MARKIKYRLDGAENFRLLNFATGSYCCTCVVCKSDFVGDKRAVMCLSCAIKAVEEKFTSTNSASDKILLELSKGIKTAVRKKDGSIHLQANISSESFEIIAAKLRT